MPPEMLPEIHSSSSTTRMTAKDASGPFIRSSHSGSVFEPRRGPLRRSRREVPDVRHERAVRVLEAHFIVPLEKYVVVRPVAGAVRRGSLRTKREGRVVSVFSPRLFGESASRPRPRPLRDRIFVSRDPPPKTRFSSRALARRAKTLPSRAQPGRGTPARSRRASCARRRTCSGSTGEVSRRRRCRSRG